MFTILPVLNSKKAQGMIWSGRGEKKMFYVSAHKASDGICLPSFIIRYYTQSLKEAWKIWEKNLKLNQSVEDENIKNNLQKLLCSSKLW